jgi:prepilin peptidase CpaA
MIWAAFTVLVLIAVYTDVRTNRIPNWISLALTGLFAVSAIFAVTVKGEPVQNLWPHLAIGAAVLAIGYCLYLYTNMGAGDAKLAAAISLWTGFYGLYIWNFMLAAMMMLVAIGLLILRRTLPAGITDKHPVFQKRGPVPLGFAIGPAAIAASPWFNHALFGF